MMDTYQYTAKSVVN